MATRGGQRRRATAAEHRRPRTGTSARGEVRASARGTRGYRIGEVAAVVGLTRQTLHQYVALGLIRPIRTTAGGHRVFAGSVFRRIEDIQARKRTQSLREIARDLQSRRTRPRSAKRGGDRAPVRDRVGVRGRKRS